MKTRCFHLTFRVAVRENDTHDALHLTIFNRFRKNVEDAHLKTSKDSS